MHTSRPVSLVCVKAFESRLTMADPATNVENYIQRSNYQM